jgi:hypothetical protein
MKLKIVILAMFTILLNSCSSNYVQVFETSSQNGQINRESNYVYENDSIKITYNFWEDKGKMSFIVYNKLKKPLYIDWKKSSYISNTTKINYWDDITTTNTVESKTSVGGTTNFALRKYYITNSVGVSSSASSKPERITFIPPNSNYYRTQFNLFPVKEFKIKDYQTIEKQSLINSSKTTDVFVKSLSKNESPLIFRNFITLSYNENFTNEFYVDNEFYVSKVTNVKPREFEGMLKKENSSFLQKDEEGKYIRVSPFRDEKSFFLKVRK